MKKSSTLEFVNVAELVQQEFQSSLFDRLKNGRSFTGRYFFRHRLLARGIQI